MKEIIVVKNKAFLNKTDFVCIEDIVKDLKVEYKIEKYPTNWEELLELCKKLNNKKVEIIFVNIRIIIHLDNDCEISFTDTFKDMWFKKKDFEARIKTDLTPAQMYQIIKSLIGEE